MPVSGRGRVGGGGVRGQTSALLGGGPAPCCPPRPAAEWDPACGRCRVRHTVRAGRALLLPGRGGHRRRRGSGCGRGGAGCRTGRGRRARSRCRQGSSAERSAGLGGVNRARPVRARSRSSASLPPSGSAVGEACRYTPGLPAASRSPGAPATAGCPSSPGGRPWARAAVGVGSRRDGEFTFTVEPGHLPCSSRAVARPSSPVLLPAGPVCPPALLREAAPQRRRRRRPAPRRRHPGCARARSPSSWR